MFFGGWSIEQALEQIRFQSNPRKSASILISPRFTLAQKAWLLLNIPKSNLSDARVMGLIEADFEDAGCSELARLIRWLLFCNEVPEETRINLFKWSHSAVVLDIKIRWVVQRESYLQEEIKVLDKSLALFTENDGEDKNATQCQLDDYEEEFLSMNTEFNELGRKAWQLEGNIPRGVMTRAFKTYRKDRNWYLCEWLREDCAGRGGCCGRSCGCCENSRTDVFGRSRNGWDYGHCTSACGCCIRTLGYTEDHRYMKRDIKGFPFDISTSRTPYDERLLRAYIFGVSFLDELNLI